MVQKQKDEYKKYVYIKKFILIHCEFTLVFGLTNYLNSSRICISAWPNKLRPNNDLFVSGAS